MKTLRSYVGGRWVEAREGLVPLVDPCTEEVIAQAGSAGIDFGETLSFARDKGGPALRAMTFQERGALLKAMSKALHAQRDELIGLSLVNTGATRKDAKFDLDGATFTLAHYASLGRELGDRRVIPDAEGTQLGASARFSGQHVWVPLGGCAIHINAFNFPAWGFAEKAACALLAGMPVITKPATSTALVTERCIEILVEANILPEGALSLVCGSTGNLLDLLGTQDVLAFTGSASTALGLRGKPNLLESSTRVNIEADSLNTSVLAPGVDSESETWGLFVRDVVREMTQKSGQKCTAVRRVLVPADRLDEVRETLVERLGETVVGHPADASVTMGPLATRQQLDDTVSGVAELETEASRVLGSGARIDGVGAEPGRGFFFEPTLLVAHDPMTARVLHDREVFGPVSTLMAYDGDPAQAAEIVAKGGGSLVTSVYGNDVDWLGGFLASGGRSCGRLYVGSEKVAGQMPGSGVAMPAMLHGGPGRAGGGSELGGLRGLELYQQRVGVMGDRALIERLAGLRS